MKQQQRKDATSQNFIQAFWNLYRFKDISKITVQDVSQKAGYHRSTFYQYYTDVYSLLEEAEADFIRQFTRLFDGYSGDNFTGWFIRQFSDFNEKNGDILCLLLSQRGDPAFGGKLKKAVIPYLYQHLHIPAEDEDIHYVFDFIITAVISFFVTWYEQGKIYSTDHAVQTIRRLLLHGVIDTISEHSLKPDVVKSAFEVHSGM